MNTLLLYFKECRVPALRLAHEAGLPVAEIMVHHFPDGESLVTLPDLTSEKVAIYQSLNNPNEKIVELLLAARGARRKGVKKVTLIAPYLAYMRQDRAFKKGQVVSQKVIGLFLSELFESLITVDAHLHRVKSLGKVLPGCKALNLKTAKLTARYIQEHYHDPPFLLGPDEESLQWVKAIAEEGGFDYGVCRKVRYGDDRVKVELPRFNLRNRQIVIVDDIVSTGHTVAEAAKRVLEKGAGAIDCVATHGLFVRGALSLLRRSGIRRIATADTVPHSTNRIFIAPIIASALSSLI